MIFLFERLEHKLTLCLRVLLWERRETYFPFTNTSSWIWSEPIIAGTQPRGRWNPIVDTFIGSRWRHCYLESRSGWVGSLLCRVGEFANGDIWDSRDAGVPGIRELPRAPSAHFALIFAWAAALTHTQLDISRDRFASKMTFGPRCFFRRIISILPVTFGHRDDRVIARNGQFAVFPRIIKFSRFSFGRVTLIWIMAVFFCLVLTFFWDTIKKDLLSTYWRMEWRSITSYWQTYEIIQ